MQKEDADPLFENYKELQDSHSRALNQVQGPNRGWGAVGLHRSLEVGPGRSHQRKEDMSPDLQGSVCTKCHSPGRSEWKVIQPIFLEPPGCPNSVPS